MAPLLNKKIVVVGGSSGIGFSVAKAVLAQGASVVIASSNAARLEQALVRLGAGDRARAEVLDVRSEKDIQAFFGRVGKIDHFVYSPGDPIVLGFGDENAKSAFDIRYWGMIFCAKHSRRLIAESFTATSGTISYQPITGWTLVAGMAGAVLSSIRNLANDYRPVRYNTVVPGLVDTEMWDMVSAEEKATLYESSAKRIPVQHVGTPDEVAEAYLYLMKCGYVNGQNIHVDGGANIADRGIAIEVYSSAT